jgi:hypothetical protein
MNCCREITKMGVPARHREPARSGEAGGPPGNRRVLVPRRTKAVRRRDRYQRTPGRTAISVVAASDAWNIRVIWLR